MPANDLFFFLNTTHACTNLGSLLDKFGNIAVVKEKTELPGNISDVLPGTHNFGSTPVTKMSFLSSSQISHLCPPLPQHQYRKTLT